MRVSSCVGVKAHASQEGERGGNSVNEWIETEVGPICLLGDGGVHAPPTPSRRLPSSPPCASPVLARVVALDVLPARILASEIACPYASPYVTSVGLNAGLKEVREISAPLLMKLYIA